LRQILVGQPTQLGGQRQRAIHRCRRMDLRQRDGGDHLVRMRAVPAAAAVISHC
jgi:hypothetical protein